MAYPARQLITEAYYVSSILGESYQTPTTAQTAKGLSLLNRVLSGEAITGRLIPYYKTYEFNATVGEEKYFIENLIDIDVETFNIGSVRFSTRNVRRKRFFGNARADNINSLPLSWHLERTTGGSYLYVYFKAANTYPIKFIGKFGFDSVTLDTDLSTLYDLFYIDYLTFKVARRICANNSIQFTPENEQTLLEFEQQLRDMSPLDLTMEKISTLQRRSGYSYADINLGRGWTPPL